MREKMLKIKEVERMVGVKRGTIHRWVRSGRFPAPLKLSRTSALWKESDILAWIDSLPKAKY